ncbi:MAG: polysaccharide deacetylase family protein [Candidatus Hodarchaeota archaeon]
MYTILTYHTIGDYGEILPAGINTSIEVFQSHMDYLYQQKYRVVPLDQIVDHIIKGRKLKHKTLAITFDDGYEDHFLYAYPTLKRCGFPATIFVTVKYIDAYWESEKAEEGRIKGLSNDQILEMNDGGLIQFGSHGYSHSNLLSANGEQRVFEIRDSKLFLEELLGTDVPFISYPFGDCDDGIKGVVANAGYRAGFSVWNKKPDIYSIRRVPLHTHDGLMRFKFKVSPLYSLTKSLFRFS